MLRPALGRSLDTASAPSATPAQEHSPSSAPNTKNGRRHDMAHGATQQHWPAVRLKYLLKNDRFPTPAKL